METSPSALCLVFVYNRYGVEPEGAMRGGLVRRFDGVSLIIPRPDEWEEGKTLQTRCAENHRLPVTGYPEGYISILDGGVKGALIVPGPSLP